ncbi:GNAT family N-acetyltransferase [Cellulosimicrobium cellulans]|uniref:GNAT family N-acetyltransferase n=1 Tax=Cellulosimicrobium cellulans TaxID=1710 RepID=UPI0019664FC1|nr:GNAT family N-acetyltransferase [Cellulosimicrobium cellulans]MBN0038854.1 GNAT family N-acetyltransferase [Cellulosimicrobium cellulans]
MTSPTPSSFDVRPLEQEDRDQALDVVWRAFGWGYRQDAADDVFAGRSIEADRTLVAVDGSRSEVVGTASAYSLRMTMPGGGSQPVAGVWMVTVAPTHRRRGVMTAMMRRQLTDLAAGGEAVAALWATEAGVYGRYGYGIASWRQPIEVDLSRAAFTPHATRLVAGSPARLHLMSLPAALPHLAAIHDDLLATRPGTLARDADRWQFLLGGGDGRPPAEIVVALGPDGPTGFAAYRVREGEAALVPRGVVAVQEVGATDPATHAQLWRYLLDLDLVSTLTCESRPVPDPLAHLLADHRRMHARLDEALWVRVVDVERALGARAFSAPVDLVLDVTDDAVPANAGRWHVVVGEAGGTAAVRRTDARPDLSMDVADLGAAHLGATPLHVLALAGRVVEHTPGAVAAAAAAWSWSPTAHTAEIF